MGESSEGCNYPGNWGSIEDKSRCPVSSLSAQTKGCISSSLWKLLWIGAEAGCSMLWNEMCSMLLCCWWAEFLNLHAWHVCVQRIRCWGASRCRSCVWLGTAMKAPAPRPGAHRSTGLKGAPALPGAERLKQQSTRAMGRSREPEGIQSWAMPQPHGVWWRDPSTTCPDPLLHSHCFCTVYPAFSCTSKLLKLDFCP